MSGVARSPEPDEVPAYECAYCGNDAPNELGRRPIPTEDGRDAMGQRWRYLDGWRCLDRVGCRARATQPVGPSPTPTPDGQTTTVDWE